MKAPAFQFYVSDFLGGTLNFTAEEAGAYVFLLCRQWDKGYILEEEIEEISRTNKDKLDRVLRKFKRSKKGLFNKRLETCRRGAIKFLEKKSKSGKIGAKKRWHKELNNNELNGAPIISPMAKHSSSSSSSSSSIAKQASLVLIYETMRNGTSRQQFSDALLSKEAESLLNKYGDVKDVNSLVAKWIQNLKPDLEPKKMQI